MIYALQIVYSDGHEEEISLEPVSRRASFIVEECFELSADGKRSTSRRELRLENIRSFGLSEQATL